VPKHAVHFLGWISENVPQIFSNVKYIYRPQIFSNVKYIYRQRRMSRVQIRGADAWHRIEHFVSIYFTNKYLHNYRTETQTVFWRNF